MEKVRKQIVEMVKRSKSILLMPSAPVDGDSLGSSLALYLVFKKLGKQVTVVCADPVPDSFQFLPTTKVISHDFSLSNDFIVTLDCAKSKLKTIETKLEHDKFNIIITAKAGQFTDKDVSFHHGPSKYDLIITVDTGDLSQLGRFYEDNPELFTSIPVVNIDHHASNDFFGKINYVDVMSSSTTELLIPLIHDFEKDSELELMDEDIATLLLAGIITDTGSFQNANTTPRSFAASALLVKHGARQQEIIHHVFKTKHLSTLKLWGRILSHIKVDQQHKFVWSTISRKDFDETRARDDETGGIIDELLTNAPGTEIVLLLKERTDGMAGGSLRSTTPAVDVSQIAEMFGGGGHVQASGFKFPCDNFEEAAKMIVEKIREFQAKRLGVSANFQENIENETKKIAKKSQQKEQNEPSNEGKEEKTEKRVSSKTVTKSVSKDKNMEETSFTETVVKKAKPKDNVTTFELEPGFTYKFED
ncbi:DHH family phosphoesterase [Candidatus Peregrinibacteria bacterium]|nr:DHH family phosphoesterase [Candidatus Peregrinibacteria bacterium]